jgi:hypothetical protein
VYGVPQTINTANYVYFLAVQELTELARHAAAVAKGKGKGKGKASGTDGEAEEAEEAEERSLVAVVNGEPYHIFWMPTAALLYECLLHSEASHKLVIVLTCR